MSKQLKTTSIVRRCMATSTPKPLVTRAIALRRPLAPAARPDDLVESRLRKRDITHRKRDIRGAGGRLVFQEKNLEPLPLQEFFYKTLSYKYEDLRKYVPSGPSKGASRHLGRQLRIHPYAWELSIHPGPDSRAL